jgi:hypothetical protein
VSGFNPLRVCDLERLEVALQKDIELYQLDKSPNLMLIQKLKPKFKNEPLRLLIHDNVKDLETIITPIRIIHNERIIANDKTCRNAGCYFTGDHMARHEQSCSREISPIQSVQTAYGQRSDIIYELVNLNLLPKCAVEYRKTSFCKIIKFIM